MALLDMPLDELERYAPARMEPADFDSFWAMTIDDAHRHELSPRFDRVDYGLRTIDSYDVTFSGFAGQRIKGWLMLPRDRSAAQSGGLPCMVQFVGYGGGRATPLDALTWASLGLAHLLMDTRGQGSTWSSGDTPDPDPEGANPHYPGFMTLGILDPRTYYYRRVFTDAMRAVETALAHPAVNARHVGVTGGSQGGGIALAVAGLAPTLLGDRVRICLPEVPFLCHYRRATSLVNTFPYQEIVRYCKVHRDKIGTVFETLSYFDGVNFAPRVKADALFSVGLMDDICPPSTVYAAYNHYAGPKQIRVWPFNQHEGGQTAHLVEQIGFLRQAGWIE